LARITALERQARDGERINVYLDGEFAFGLAAITAQQAGLCIGRELSRAELDDLLREDAFQKALNRALVFLGYRPRSESEVRQRLAKAKFEPPLIERVVERLHADGLLDDLAFARYWTENREAFNPRGARLLSLELRRKGVDREVIDEALEGALDEDEGALAAGRRKLKQLSGLEYREFRQKMGAYLARRGFDYDTARDAVAKLWQESQGESPDEDE